MLRVGLSGGIGSGKSTVAARLAGHGAVVVDSDRIAREVVAPGTAGLGEVVQRFGREVMAQDGSLDRPALGRLVFADPVARRDLEAITHPRIAERTAELMAAAPEDAVVVHDVPLLVEKGMGAAYHLVVIVAVAEQERLRRLVCDRGMDPEQARSRIASQADDRARLAAADVWLDNAGSPGQLQARVDELWHERLVPFERNVREGVVVRRAEPAPDAEVTRPGLAERLLARLRCALDPLTLTAEPATGPHAAGGGSDDPVQLRVSARDLRELDRPEVATRLAGAGFVPVGAVDDAGRPARLYGYADPAVAVRVEVTVSR